MHDGSQFIDIIFFAMVAVFLGLRLRSVLGRRTGNERPPAANFASAKPRPAAPIDVPEVAPGDTSVDAGLKRIRLADPAFTPDSFCKGAAAAFQMIIVAFAKADEAALRPLLTDEVFENFSRAIRARQAAGEVCENQLVGIDAVDIVEAGMDGLTARVGVRFKSRQIILVKDAEGRIVEGAPGQPVSLTDLWRFVRDTRRNDPNWLLVSTDSLDD